MLRLFIALDLPPEVRATLQAMQAQLRGYRLPIRWTDPAGAHLTLKFLGATDPGQVAAITGALETIARKHAPFELVTAGPGCFPNLHAPRVVWLGLGGAVDALARLRDDVERTIAPLGFPTETRPFSPHLTLGRTNKDATRQESAAIGPAIKATPAPPRITWQVRRLSLMRSELGPAGARYTCLAQAGLDTA
jgi:RNA 2',3'-cyclic 3'-phosphodiesterase